MSSTKKLALIRAFKKKKLTQLVKAVHTFKTYEGMCSGGFILKIESHSSHLEIPDGLCHIIESNCLKYMHISPDGNCFFQAVAVNIACIKYEWTDCLHRIGYKNQTQHIFHYISERLLLGSY